MSVLWRCLEGVKQRVESVVGDADLSTIIRKLPVARDRMQQLPIICVTPTSEQTSGRFFGGRFVDYGLVVGIIVAGNGSLIIDDAKLLNWRDRIRDDLDDRGLLGVPEVVKISHESDRIYDTSQLNCNYDYSILNFLIQTHQREGTLSG